LSLDAGQTLRFGRRSVLGWLARGRRERDGVGFDGVRGEME
jgi:hypothetical protein